MRRTYYFTDKLYKLAYILRRNKTVVLIYFLLCLLFIVVGIAVGVNVSDKTAYALGNDAGIFMYLRGDRGAVALFFTDFLFSAVYCIFAASMFFNRIVSLASAAPAMYKSYSLGLNVSITIAVFSVSAVPMLIVVFIPASLIEIGVLCYVSARCFCFYSLNKYCLPTRHDVFDYYKKLSSVLIFAAGCSLAKVISLVLFGSALVGIL